MDDTPAVEPLTRETTGQPAVDPVEQRVVDGGPDHDRSRQHREQQRRACRGLVEDQGVEGNCQEKATDLERDHLDGPLAQRFRTHGGRPRSLPAARAAAGSVKGAQAATGEVVVRGRPILIGRASKMECKGHSANGNPAAPRGARLSPQARPRDLPRSIPVVLIKLGGAHAVSPSTRATPRWRAASRKTMRPSCSNVAYSISSIRLMRCSPSAR